MKGKVIDKKLIESIVRKDNVEYVKTVTDKVNYVVSNAIDELSHQIAYVNLDNTILQPVNELLTGAFTDNSKFVYFLGIDSAQLELNTMSSTNFWKRIKNKIVFAWKTRSKRKKRRWLKRKKKKDDEQLDSKIYDFDPSKYNIYNLCEDLQTAIAKFSALTSIVYLEETRLRIIGKDDYGSNAQIIIYPVLFNGETFKFYTGRKKGFVEIDVQNRLNLLEQKYQKLGQNYVDMLKVFNVLYFYANKNMPNQVFIESLLYSVPDELFKGTSAYNSFVKIINYLTMTNIKEVPSLNNPEKTIFTDPISAASGLGYERFINQFVYLNEKQTAKSDQRPSDKPKSKYDKLKKIVKNNK